MDVVRIDLSVRSSRDGRKMYSSLVVSQHLERAAEEIERRIVELATSEPHMLLLNGTPVRQILNRNRGHRLREGDCFTVMPLVSGG
jgi:hypothetical protein